MQKKYIPKNSLIHKNLTITISYLEATDRSISSWMAANLLTLNSSKTKFMLIDLPQQLSKIHNPPLSLIPYDQSHLVRNLGFIFDSSLSFNNKISLSSICHCHICDLHRITRFGV